MVEIHNGYRIIDTETGSETESEVLVEGPKSRRRRRRRGLRPRDLS